MCPPLCARYLLARALRAVEVTCQRAGCDARRLYHAECTQDFFGRTAGKPGTDRWIGPHDLRTLRLAGASACRGAAATGMTSR